jgi:hypothetical protein
MEDMRVVLCCCMNMLESATRIKSQNILNISFAVLVCDVPWFSGPGPVISARRYRCDAPVVLEGWTICHIVFRVPLRIRVFVWQMYRIVSWVSSG